MRTPLALTALLGAAIAVAAALPQTHGAQPPAEPAADTVVSVTGDAANGFEITYYDGSGEYPPTDSEAMAECAEYEPRIERVKCRAEVRTWYRDLATLRDALDWAHASRG
ncbi:hypothetical protein [Microbacterium oleivorans]|uniref:Secreted protein n=1 Tax=Microbacterium oleivorans TaxID=273677 RepID=A0A4R5YFR1_9MICO|nr:hypothetical protein [Microbacterium oleivorans]TDL43625.1 hypothetical protein E2R54_10460 [Microbacterium oleivorans]